LVSSILQNYKANEIENWKAQNSRLKVSVRGLSSCRIIPRIVPYSNDESGSSVAPSLRRRSHNPCIEVKIILQTICNYGKKTIAIWAILINLKFLKRKNYILFPTSQKHRNRKRFTHKYYLLLHVLKVILILHKWKLHLWKVK
jgi:hypothetical protein